MGVVSAGVGCAGGGRKNGADDVLSIRKWENRRDRGNQRTVLRGAEFRLQEEGSRWRTWRCCCMGGEKGRTNTQK